MIRNIKRTYFEIWGNEEAQNIFLKGLLVILSILFAIQSIALVTMSLRKPVLIAIGNSETRVFQATPPSRELLEQELRRTVKLYVETHYNWDGSTIEKAHGEAAKFVSEKFIKGFVSANAEQVRIAKERHIKQIVYVSGEIKVDSKNLSAHVPMDRILIIDGLRAATPFILDISFEYGPRTDSNSQGIYVTGEKISNS